MTIPDMMYCERSVESMVTSLLQEKDSEVPEDQKVKGMEWLIACLSIPPHSIVSPSFNNEQVLFLKVL
jgi:hypothetical protein